MKNKMKKLSVVLVLTMLLLFTVAATPAQDYVVVEDYFDNILECDTEDLMNIQSQNNTQNSTIGTTTDELIKYQWGLGANGANIIAARFITGVVNETVRVGVLDDGVAGHSVRNYLIKNI